MKVSYEVRFSQLPWPRVMRYVGQPTHRSVHRGMVRLCIELRNQVSARPTLFSQGEGNSGFERNGKSETTSTESKTTCMTGNSPRGSWEVPGTSNFSESDRSEQVRYRNADMHVSGKSDSLVVPKKRANNVGQPTAAESVEERRLTKENVKRLLMVRTQSRVAISHGLFGVRMVTEIGQGNLAETRSQSSSSKVGAVCGSSARTDLCGGRPAMAVPTAIAPRLASTESYSCDSSDSWSKLFYVFCIYLCVSVCIRR